MMKLRLFFILFPLLLFSQTYDDSSNAFNTIIKDSTLNLEIKEQKVKNLLNFYNINSQNVLFVNTLYNYAKWQYVTVKNTDKAINTSIECISKIQDLGFQKKEYNNYIIYNRALNNLGYFYGKKGDYYNAYKTYEKISQVRPVNENIIIAHSLSAKYLTLLGDFYKGAERYEEAIKFAYDNNNLKAVIRISNDASICYKKTGTGYSLNKGIELLKNATELAKKTKNINYKYIFNLYEQLGNLYNEREDYDFVKSKKNYDIALQIATQNNDLKLTSLVNIDLAYLYIHINNKKALLHLEKAMTFDNEDKVKSLIYANKSLYFYKTKNHKMALENIQKSINTISPVSIINLKENPSKDDLLISMHKYDLLSRLISKSKVWLAYYEKENKDEIYLLNALETLRLADFLVDDIRLDSKEQQSKLFWRKKASEIYTNAVKACFALNNTEEAFYFMEKNKAILLLEDITEEQIKENIGFPQKIRDKQLNLEIRINTLKTIINRNNSSKDSILPHLTKAKKEYYNFIEDLESRFPLLYNSQKKPVILSLNTVKKTIKKDDKAYIEYILNKDNAFGLLITKATTKLFKIQNYDFILDNLNTYKKLLNSPLKTSQDMATCNTLSNTLYQSILPEQIANNISDKKLVIIADYLLQDIPFETLINNRGNYLIQEHEISYAYSISFSEQNKKKHRDNQKEFLGFAPVHFKNQLNNLPETEQETKEASKLFSSKLFQYDNATRDNFITNIEKHTIIHIASHANVNDSISPWIAFSDKKLFLEDLYLTNNTADLVVLSACKTSLGALKEGEGIMSLARGFFNTGANSVLSTQWNVNDKSSSKIVIDFYKHLKSGKTKSQALQLSKLNYLKTHQLSELSPYYWASFVLIGDSKNISSLKNNRIPTYILTILLISSIAFLLYLKIKK